MVLPKPYLTGFTVPRPKPKPPDPPPLVRFSAASSSHEIQATYEDVDWSEARMASNSNKTSKSVTFSSNIEECRDSLDDLSSSSSSSSAVATFVPMPGTATSAVDEMEMHKLTPRSETNRPHIADDEIEYFMINLEGENVPQKTALNRCKGCLHRHHQRDPRHSRVYGECRYPFVDSVAYSCPGCGQGAAEGSGKHIYEPGKCKFSELSSVSAIRQVDCGHRSQDTDIFEDPRVLGTWKRCPGCVNRFPATHSLHTFLVGECLAPRILDAEVEVPMVDEELEGEGRSESRLETSQADNQLLEHPLWQMCQGCHRALHLHHPMHSRVIGECRFPFTESGPVSYTHLTLPTNREV